MDNMFYTYSNRAINSQKMSLNDVDIVDIAHSLSQICRGNGHYRCFYSVAQHSINCYLEAISRKLSHRIKFACLLHDASEAYISDISRPFKMYLQGYKKIESKIQNCIFERYEIELSNYDKEIVREIDDYMLKLELCELMSIDTYKSSMNKEKDHYFTKKK